MSNANARPGPSSPPSSRGKAAGGGGGWSWRARKEDVVIPRPGFSRRAEPTLYPQGGVGGGGGGGGSSAIRIKPGVSAAMASMAAQRSSPPAADLGEEKGASDVWTPGKDAGMSAYNNGGGAWGYPDYYGRGWGSSNARGYDGSYYGPSDARRRSSAAGDRDAGYPSRGQRSDPSSASSPPRNNQHRRQQHDVEEALRIDWPVIESRAKDNGFVVPSDLVVEFKRQGHFDSLRRSLLQSFLSSSPQAKGEVVDSISDLLLGYIEGNPAEAAKIMAMSGGDARLMQAEMVKVVEMEEPKRAKVKRRHSGEEYTPPSGPQIQRDLLAKMQQEKSEGEERDAILSILSTSASPGIARTISERVEALLKEEEEKRGRIVDREGEEGKTPAIAAGTSPSSGEATPATPAQGKDGRVGAAKQEEQPVNEEEMADVEAGKQDKPGEDVSKRTIDENKMAKGATKTTDDMQVDEDSQPISSSEPTSPRPRTSRLQDDEGDEASSSQVAGYEEDGVQRHGVGAGEEADMTIAAAEVTSGKQDGEAEVGEQQAMEVEEAPPPPSDLPLD